MLRCVTLVVYRAILLTLGYACTKKGHNVVTIVVCLCGFRSWEFLYKHQGTVETLVTASVLSVNPALGLAGII